MTYNFMNIKNRKGVNMVKKLKLNTGFTLVELLIVITLIAILAVAIVATLNPIEQINRARDARYKNDASELLSAIERYYTSTGEYPWMSDDFTDPIISNVIGFSATGEDAGVGVCEGAGGSINDDGNCGDNGILITADELKPQFRNKSQFTPNGNVTPQNKLYIVKPEDSSAIYVCFIPIANVNHTPTERVRLWDLGMYGTGLEVPDYVDEPTEITTLDDLETTPPAWEDMNDSLFMCVPE